MAYISKNDLLTYFSPDDLMAALDDDNDGSEDAGLLASIIENCSSDIDGALSSIYATPFNPVPPMVRNSCLIFVCEAIYARRRTPDQLNPFKDRAAMLRKRLGKIGDGELPLDLNFPREFAPVASVLSPALVNATMMG